MKIHLEPFSKSEKSHLKKEYYELYFSNYYNDKIYDEYGVKELLTLIKNYSTKGNWLDLGSGPTSLFWATAFEYEINSVTLIDISPYPFEVISRIRKSKIFPFAYIEALNYLNKDIKFLEEFCDINWKYKVTNVFTDNFIQHKFKNITAMGLIG
ncbi:hypothetical protein OHW91_18300, partial [Acinetobacter baumannii]|nr:hypothetical protein [Acinetobacter baumannii]